MEKVATDSSESSVHTKNIFMQTSYFNMEALSDEVILRVFTNLETRNLIQCSLVSKRFRNISCDISLWQKLDFSDMKLSTQLLKIILNRGCMDLDLNSAELTGNLYMEKTSQLRKLDLSFCKTSQEVVENLLASCHSLQKVCYT